MNYANRTEPGATATPRGMELDMGSLSILSPAGAEARTASKTASGPVECRTPATESATIPGHSGLTDEERMKLAKIRRNRAHGWMPTFEEFDFLLTLVEALTR